MFINSAFKRNRFVASLKKIMKTSVMHKVSCLLILKFFIYILDIQLVQNFGLNLFNYLDSELAF